jgi:hypothetical protein
MFPMCAYLTKHELPGGHDGKKDCASQVRPRPTFLKFFLIDHTNILPRNLSNSQCPPPNSRTISPTNFFASPKSISVLSR